MTINVDVSKLTEALRIIEDHYMRTAAWQADRDYGLTPVVAMAAGLAMAGSATKKVTRRSLLSLGFLRGKG
jgi:hypothetical protein